MNGLTNANGNIFKQWWFWLIVAGVSILVILLICRSAERFSNKKPNNLGLDSNTDMMSQLKEKCMQHGPFVFLAMDGCGWCTKLKSTAAPLIESGILEVVNVSTPRGKALAQKHNVKGFPHILHEKGYSEGGYKDLEKLVKDFLGFLGL
tara:strand:- start:118 stop:564 length:447 start_codon:yes stop_codon:yes gene_type:complete